MQIWVLASTFPVSANQALSDLKMNGGNITLALPLWIIGGAAAMWTSSPAIPLFCKDSIRIACCILLFWCTPTTSQEYSPDSRSTEAAEREALKLLNDSDWAHTVKPSLQETPCCGYRKLRPI